MALTLTEVKELPRSNRGEWAAQYIPLVNEFSKSNMTVAQINGIPENKAQIICTAIRKYVSSRHINNVYCSVRKKRVYLIKVNE